MKAEEFIGMIARMTTNAEMSGDDAVEALSNLSELARELTPAAAPEPMRSAVTGMRCGSDALTPHAEVFGHEYAPNGSGRCRQCGQDRNAALRAMADATEHARQLGVYRDTLRAGARSRVDDLVQIFVNEGAEACDRVFSTRASDREGRRQ